MYFFNQQAWEDVCDRCGLCCYEREISDDGVQAVNLSAPCKFLDTECNLCTVYDKRFKLLAYQGFVKPVNFVISISPVQSSVF